MLLGMTLPAPVRAQQLPGEYSVKAALLLKLPYFVYWRDEPDNRSGPRLVCLIGDNPFGSALEEAAARAKPPRRVESRGIDAGVAGCDLLFVGASEAARLPELLPFLRRPGLLTVSDIPGFARAGGMVEFALERGHVTLVINRGEARRQSLDFTAPLLQLAHLIEP